MHNPVGYDRVPLIKAGFSCGTPLIKGFLPLDIRSSLRGDYFALDEGYEGSATNSFIKLIGFILRTPLGKTEFSLRTSGPGSWDWESCASPKCFAGDYTVK